VLNPLLDTRTFNKVRKALIERFKKTSDRTAVNSLTERLRRLCRRAPGGTDACSIAFFSRRGLWLPRFGGAAHDPGSV